LSFRLAISIETLASKSNAVLPNSTRGTGSGNQSVIGPERTMYALESDVKSIAIDARLTSMPIR
jgi:hypothetical protein